MTGFEPATAGATVRSSTTELHPPYCEPFNPRHDSPLGPSDPLPSAETALARAERPARRRRRLSVPRLLDAYRRGIFPWFNEGDPVLWWTPDPRMVLPPDASTSRARCAAAAAARRCRSRPTPPSPRSMRRLRRAARRRRHGTWLTADMRGAYDALHAAGLAHSVEVWMDGELAGGIYGVAHRPRCSSASRCSRAAPTRSKIAMVLPGRAARPLGLAADRLPAARPSTWRRWARERAAARVRAPRSAQLVEQPRRRPWQLDADLAGSAEHAPAGRRSGVRAADSRGPETR